MFCPSCGQVQASEEIRFCSRCGFSMEIVAQLLHHSGYLPQLEEINKQQNSRFTRRNGLKFALFWFLTLTLFLAPVAEAAGINRLPELFAALGVCGGLLILVFSMLFLKKAPSSPKDEQLNPIRQVREPKAFRSAGNKNVLPPQQSVPASAYVPLVDTWKAPDTYDLNRPGSITEGTTQHLEKDK
ncbi:MAG: hypothetical protein M3209_02435 [Acidobacteriota bacterium]|nr:hypothetical protein [Acidobacteriota bacterium]